MALSGAASDLICIRVRDNAQKVANLADAYLKRQANSTPDTGVIADMNTATAVITAELETATTEDLANYNA